MALGGAVAARVVADDVDTVGVERFRNVAHGGVVGRCGEPVHEDDGQRAVRRPEAIGAR